MGIGDAGPERTAHTRALSQHVPYVPPGPGQGGGPRGLLAAVVADVDAAYEELKAKGVTFVRPPTDQSWGLRTAHFADPEGNLWEINQSIEAKPEG
jgi:uncharacterized glyoxalase superfamily protein PhnB